MLFSILVAFFQFGIAQENELKVIKPHWVQFTEGKNALYNHLASEAFELLDKREKELLKINDLAGWKQRQNIVKDKFMDIVGPFPEKNPLNAKITRKIDKEGYRIEHIVFESQPNFYVSSSLFIPDDIKGKAPAIIYCSGHHILAYRNATYQHVILNLVKKGFIVFALDPVGQGERLEYFDEEDHSSTIGGPTKQHSYPGAQAFMAGTSMAKYMIWDGIRAVDYLLTRPEVDKDRIGITGRSGGGTQSSYIAAFDERIYASAPENYITTFKRLWYTHGPQDAEQNLYSAIQSGLDLPDLLTVRAPKPNMMITTTSDIFNIEGAREAAEEIQRIYSAYGQSENFLKVEDDAGHASTLKNREAMYSFFQEHLQLPGNANDEGVDTLSQEELQVSPTGQVLSSYDGLRTEDLNQQYLKEQENKIKPSLEDLEKTVRDLSGYQNPDHLAETMLVGRIQRDGYVIEKHLMKGEGDYWIPYLLMKPEKETKTAVLYLDPEGKQTDAGKNSDMEALVRGGAMVLAPDLLNTGEMGNGDFTGDANFNGHSYNFWFGGILINRSIVGIHAGDANRLVKVLQEKEGATQIKGLAKGQMTSVLLHAAVFNPALKALALVNPMGSFKSVVEDPNYQPADVAYTVAGALPRYDLPVLLEHLSDRSPMILGNTHGEKEPAISIEGFQGDRGKNTNRIKAGTDEERRTYLMEWVGQ
ncbi:MAG: acetylxylan esterase [Cyclobacteriaceae bacterium]